MYGQGVDGECLVIKCTILVLFSFVIIGTKIGDLPRFLQDFPPPPRSLEIGLFCILCTIRAIGIVKSLCVFFILLSGQVGVALCFTTRQSFICCDNIMPSIDNLSPEGKSTLCGRKRRRRKNKILYDDESHPGRP